MKELVILGSGGWIPTLRRQTCCYLYKTDNSILFLDAGTGVSNLYKYADQLKMYKTINLVLSHYHIDHLVGLSYLLNWLDESQKLNIWGPGVDFYGKPCSEILSGFIGHPYFSRPIANFTNRVTLSDYSISNFFVDDLEIRVNMQNHSDPSFGLRIDNVLFYATDTSVSEETFKLAKQTKLLLHECWQFLPDKKSSKHSSLNEILDLAKKYKIENLGIIHINPNWTLHDEKNAETLLADLPNAFVANDLITLNLNSGNKQRGPV